ncbi:L-erythro-3,5-diaminohexanoate dehydrogenase [Melghirimyces profundicolus]|uniref:L-erythro-3,5-diaminohexanoate dehydrogenase n=1 Tax=Melghirimyces profundicolus TaxID=1242148 RepID=A0A2T6C2C5_9BACL|nr:L-erythro-3,5-diaminohexanoate dehydrogenase [Melghirimyces profundicolus]PTX62465.1 L-erythro-3,5-diaminohexanoate dehydrogenase [Melghirimyces profundicolus]
MKPKKKGHRFGLHRVLEPTGVLPQPSWKLDPEPVCCDNELLIEVTRLNIDSASFNQMKEESGVDPEGVKERILSIVRERGKMHNPVTGSGGMLIGRVAEIGPAFPGRELRPGDRIAALVSLSLTPLSLSAIQSVDMETGQVEVCGTAVLFASGPYAVLPDDLPEPLALAVLDVCGAPAQVARLVHPGQTVAVMGGGGKSGLLSLYQARKQAGAEGRILALEAGAGACEAISSLNVADHVIRVDARDPVAVLEAVEQATGGALADLTFNCVNVPGTELSTVLATRDGGTVYHFSTAVRFTTAALGAEGLGKDVHMMIGNGFAPGHAERALEILRESPGVRAILEKRYQVTAG